MSARRLAKGFLLSLLLLLILVVTLALTSPGMRLAINQANQLDGIDINYQQGSLWSGLTLGQSQVTLPGVNVRFDAAYVDVDLSRLWLTELVINQLSLDNLAVRLSQSPPSAEPEGDQNRINSPIYTKINTLKIKDFSVQGDWGQVSLAQLKTSLVFDQALTISNTDIHKLAFNQPTSRPNSATATWFNPQQLSFAPVAAESVDIPVDIKVADLKITEILMDDQPLLDEIRTNLTLFNSQLNLDLLNIDTTDQSVSVSGKAQLSPELNTDLRIRISNQAPSLYLKDVTAQLQGGLDALSIVANISLLTQGSADLVLNTDLTQLNYPAHLQLNWQNLSLPGASVERASGTLNLQGHLHEFNAQAQTTANINNVGDMAALVEMSGGISNLELNRLTLSQQQNQVTTVGHLLWADTLQWRGHSQLAIRDLSNLNQFEAISSLKLAGQTSHNLTLSADEWQASLNLQQLQGQYRQQPMQLDGSLIVDDSFNVQLDQLSISQGNNQLLASGQLDRQQSDVEFNLQLRDIAALVPAASGQASVVGQLTGSFDAPQLQAELNADAINYQAIDIATVDGELTFKDENFDLSLVIDKATSSNHSIDKANIDFAGSLSQHQLSVKTAGGDAQLNIELTGQWQQDQWQGIWQRGRIRSDYAQLTLQQPFTLQVTPATQNVLIMPHCWVAEAQAGSLCLDKTELADNQLDWDVRIEGIQVMPILNRWVKAVPPLQTDSVFNAQIEGHWPLDGIPNAQLSASLSPADWVLNRRQNQAVIAVTQLTLMGKLTPAKAHFSTRMRSPQLGMLDGQLTIDDPVNQASLDGNIAIKKLDLKPLADISHELERLTGVIGGDVEVKGKLGDPQLFGKLTLSDASVAIRDVPLQVNRVNQTLSFDGQKANLAGTFLLGQGQGNIQGELQWLPELRLKSRIQGEALDIAYQRNMRATLSPDLTFELNPEQISLTGKLVVPEAYVKLRELPASADSPSSDVVITDVPPAEQALDRRVNLNLQVLVDPDENNKVYLDAFGLTTNMQGNLNINQRNQRIQADGIVRLINGRYRAFGQNLIIRTGELQFNGPVSQPLLSVEAIRDPDLTEDDVIAGLRLAGNVNQPQISFFSEPAMDDAASLSYLLRGTSINNTSAGQSQDSVLASMLMAAGLSRGENLVGKIGDTFGVENLALDASGQGDDTKLNLTGYIAPGVQIRYGVGVFNSAAEVALRYEITPKLYIEAMSSALRNALDLYWRFSIDKDQKSQAKTD